MTRPRRPRRPGRRLAPAARLLARIAWPWGQVLAALLIACETPASPPVAPASPEAAAPSTAAPEPIPTPPVAAPPAPGLAPPAPPNAPVAPAITILERPITYDAARVRRTIAYRQRHQDPAAADITIDPRMIILHHTGGGSLDATWRYFDRATVERGRKAIADAGDLNVSSHYLVGRDGAIVRLMPDTSMARHCVGLNHLAIGVENVGHPKRAPLTDAQVEADALLVRDLVARFPGITHLIGHHEYLAFEAHPYFRERDPDYRTRKGDPGPAFMAKVREKVADLGLQGPPAAQ